MIADTLKLNAIALRIQLKVLEAKRSADPRGSPNVCNSEVFTTQLADGSDLRPRYDIPIDSMTKRCNDFEIVALSGRTERGRPSSMTQLNFPRGQRHYLDRAVSHIDGLQIKAILGKKTVAGRHPKRSCGEAHVGLAESDFSCRCSLPG